MSYPSFIVNTIQCWLVMSKDMNNPLVVSLLDIYQQVQLGGGVLGDQGREGWEKETCGTENENFIKRVITKILWKELNSLASLIYIYEIRNIESYS